MDDRSPSMLKPTAIAGLAFGVAGGLPLVGALNCACCALIIGAGLLAAYLYSKESAARGTRFGPRDGALVGLVAGLFYALAHSVVSGAVQAAMGGLDVDAIVAQMEQQDAPQQIVDLMDRGLRMLVGPLGMVFGFFITLLLAALFATIGGLIGGTIFKVEPPPPPVVPPPAGPFSGGTFEGGGPTPPPPTI